MPHFEGFGLAKRAEHSPWPRFSGYLFQPLSHGSLPGGFVFFFRAKERAVSVLFLKLDVFVHFSLGGDGEENWGKNWASTSNFLENWLVE